MIPLVRDDAINQEIITTYYWCGFTVFGKPDDMTGGASSVKKVDLLDFDRTDFLLSDLGVSEYCTTADGNEPDHHAAHIRLDDCGGTPLENTTTITYVCDVSFDSTTCILTKKTQTLTVYWCHGRAIGWAVSTCA
jgi:hypothetical protein